MYFSFPLLLSKSSKLSIFCCCCFCCHFHCCFSPLPTILSLYSLAGGGGAYWECCYHIKRTKNLSSLPWAQKWGECRVARWRQTTPISPPCLRSLSLLCWKKKYIANELSHAWWQAVWCTRQNLEGICRRWWRSKSWHIFECLHHVLCVWLLGGKLELAHICKPTKLTAHQWSYIPHIFTLIVRQ